MKTNNSTNTDNSSFSMAFNPIANVKTVREYENEVKQLKEEIFELKTQMVGNNSTNIPKILYEASNNASEMNCKIEELLKKINLLEKENHKLLDINNTYKEQMDELNNQKFKIETETQKYKERILFLEDENKRLFYKLNKTQSNESQLRSIVNSIEGNMKELQSANSTFSNDINYYKTQMNVFQGEINALNNEINTVNNENEILKQNNHELNEQVYKLKNEIENMNDKQNEILNSFSCTNSSFNNVKQQLEKTIFDQKEKLNSNKKEIEELLNCKNQYMANLINFKNGMKTFKKITMESIYKVNENIQQLNSKVEVFVNNFRLNKKCKEILEERNYLKKFKNINDLILFFVKNETRIAEKTEIRVTKRIDNIKEQIKEAMKELNICKEYMQKKAIENKDLKKSNAKLLNESNKIKKQLENAKKFYEGVTAKFGPDCIKI
ncbi:hypothetical protein EHP00_1729 [Ecytonucleospora hepatopenaei]|uniref:Uncharacterized protein n=1 Tax=Ecytonucleospora hepatopenaei TaxID=646526 RepID=A0A1W0E6A0_9MICR|nr:hypothetical protein EHP00_1729 [Ecytonucleospora hepatopenaei]